MGTIQKRPGCALAAIVFALAACVLISLLTGCKTRYITTEVPVVLHERDSIVKVQQIHTHDTLMVRDSVYTFVKGDTILIEKWHQLQAINHVARVDTVYRDRNIEVPVEVNTTEYQEVNVLYWWQKTLIWIGCGFLLYIVITISRKNPIFAIWERIKKSLNLFRHGNG